MVEHQLENQNGLPSKTVTTPFFEIKNPGCNTCYEFNIRCLNDDTSCPDNGTPSAALKVTTADCCQHPGNLDKPEVIMTENDSRVVVNWNSCDSGSVSGFADDCTYDLQYTLGNGQESYFETLNTNKF